MVEKFSFQDIKMFKGYQSIEFKPLTIFTGPNNSGKSTLLNLVRLILNVFSGNKNIDEKFAATIFEDINISAKPYDENEPYLTNYQQNLPTVDEMPYIVKQFGINNLRIKGDTVIGVPSSIHFMCCNNTVATFDNFSNNPGLGLREIKVGEKPKEFSRDDDYYELIVHFNEIFAMKDDFQFRTKEDQGTFKAHIEFIEKNGFPDSLFKSIVSFNKKQRPIFEKYSREGDIGIFIYSEKYKNASNASFFSLISLCLLDLQISIGNNKLMQERDKNVFIDTLKIFFDEIILNPLKELISYNENSTFFSAYRGQFVDDENSQANLAFKKLYKKKSGVFDDKIIRTSGISAARVFQKSDYNYLNKWLDEFEIGSRLTKEKSWNTFKVLLKNGLELNPSELGFGSQQLLPVILGLITNPSGLYFIGEPESHLHPYLQSKLADFFVDILNFNKDQSPQLIIETHSEFLIRKLQYLIAKKFINKDLIALYYIHNPEKIPEGSSHIQRMEFRKDGIIKQEFGPGFFDESTNLAMDLLNIKKSN